MKSELTEILCLMKNSNQDIRLKILKLLDKIGLAKHNQFVKLVSKSSGLISYHLKYLNKHNLIKFNEFTLTYGITRKGKAILILIESQQEKFITEDENKICKVNKLQEHDNITLCRYCGMLIEEQNKKPGVLA